MFGDNWYSSLRFSDKNQQLYKGPWYEHAQKNYLFFLLTVSRLVTFKLWGAWRGVLDYIEIIWQKQEKNGDNWSSTSIVIIPHEKSRSLLKDVRYLCCYYYHWVEISSGAPLVTESIISPVVSVSTLTWFIRYIYYWNMQFLNNVIMIKTNILLPRS